MRFVHNIDEGFPSQYHGDELEIKQNTMSNAINIQMKAQQMELCVDGSLACLRCLIDSSFLWYLYKTGLLMN